MVFLKIQYIFLNLKIKIIKKFKNPRWIDLGFGTGLANLQNIWKNSDTKFVNFLKSAILAVSEVKSENYLSNRPSFEKLIPRRHENGHCYRRNRVKYGTFCMQQMFQSASIRRIVPGSAIVQSTHFFNMNIVNNFLENSNFRKIQEQFEFSKLNEDATALVKVHTYKYTWSTYLLR